MNKCLACRKIGLLEFPRECKNSFKILTGKPAGQGLLGKLRRRQEGIPLCNIRPSDL